MYQVGISSCNRPLNGQIFEEYSKNQIEHIELKESKYDGFDYKNVYNLSKKYGVNIWSLHLPFYPFDEFDISSSDKVVRENTISKFEEIIKRATDIGVKKFIVHPSGEPIDTDRRYEHIKCAQESLVKLAEVGDRNGGVICVEDLPRTCLGHSVDELKLLVSVDERLKICFDTNHITQEKPEMVIEAFDDRLVTIHISDFDFVDERHWLPGEGKINWRNVMSALEKIKYAGVFMYEVSVKCPATLKRDRDLTAADFRRNADAVFAGKY